MTKRGRKRRRIPGSSPAPAAGRPHAGKNGPPPGRRGRVPLVVVAVALAGLVGLWWNSSRPPRTELPRLARGSASGFNVVLITLDTTRADHLGCYGSSRVETPALDALADQGILFTDAVSVAPITLPSHASILTGLYPPNHGVRDNAEYRLGPDKTTLAEVLGSHGYDTAAFVSAFVLDGRFGLDQGFETYDDAVRPADNPLLSTTIEQRSASAVTDSAVAWLRARAADRPFFLWVHYFDPHMPYAAPEPFRTRYAERPYEGEIAYMDSQIARLVEALEPSERTLYVVVGDHGESLGEHGEKTHAVFIYDATMRVPLILACPGLFRGPVVAGDSVVSVVDLFPTVLDLLGIDAPSGDGRLLLEPRKDDGRRVYIESVAPYLDYGWSPLFGLRSHADKYILAPRPEYYDLRRDPDESDNLLERSAAASGIEADAAARELSALLADWPSVEGIAESAQTLDRETLERLESLGYVGGVSDPQAASGQDPKDVMPALAKISEATDLVQAGRHDDALRVLQEVAAEFPDNRSVLALTGSLNVLLGREEVAEIALRRHIAIRPTARTLILLAQILFKRKAWDEADALLARAIEIDPDDATALLVLGDLAAGRSRIDDALGFYRRAEQLEPERMAPALKRRKEIIRRWQARSK